MKKQTLTLAVVSIFLNQLAFATPFRIVGTRAVGMGGANVAVAEGPDAQYWNPGALGVTTGSGFQMPVNASFEATGNVLGKADAISKAADAVKDAQNAQKSGTPLTLQQVNSFNDALLKVIDLNNGGTGALIDASAGLQNRFGSVALSFNQYADVGLQPFVDPNFSLGAGGGGAGVTLTGDGSLNDASLAASRDALATSIGNLNTKLQLGLGDTTTNVANKLINDALTSGMSPTDVANLVNNTNSLVNTLLPQVSGTGTDISHNQTRIDMTGAAISEFALGYGHPVMTSDKWGLLSLGGNVKALRGEVGFASVRVIDGDDTSVSNALSDAKKNIKTSVKPAIDLGLMYRFPTKHRLQLGLLGRNLNSPSFDTPDLRISEGLGKYKEDAQGRAGVAFWPLKRWMLTGDVDLTKNKTAIPGYESQTWGAGTEFKIWLLDLRAGLSKNFGAGTPLTYTAGFGINIGAFKIDAGGAVSSKTVKLKSDGQAIPANAQVAINIGLVFGRGQEKSPQKETTNAEPVQNSFGDSSAATPAAKPAAVPAPAENTSVPDSSIPAAPKEK